MDRLSSNSHWIPDEPTMDLEPYSIDMANVQQTLQEFKRRTAEMGIAVIRQEAAIVNTRATYIHDQLQTLKDRLTTNMNLIDQNVAVREAAQSTFNDLIQKQVSIRLQTERMGRMSLILWSLGESHGMLLREVEECFNDMSSTQSDVPSP